MRLKYCCLSIFLVCTISPFSFSVLANTPPVPKQVEVGLRVLDIRKVDDRRESIRGEFVLSMSWTDTSLTVDGQESEISIPVAEVDFPTVMVRGVEQIEGFGQSIVKVSPNGVATYRHRYIGDIHQSFNFKEFPFDTQIWTIDLFNPEVGQFRIEFNPSYLEELNHDSLSTTNWEVKYLGYRHSELSNFGDPVQMLHLDFKLKRNPVFYIWKVMIPIMLVVFMSWSVFWISPTNISAQLTVSVTAILTLVAFQFSVSQLMPPLSYLTKMDLFTIVADISVFLAFVETIITSYLQDRGQQHVSEKIDYYFRFLFPIAFVVTMTFILF